MKHVKSYKIFEFVEEAEVLKKPVYKTYTDRMSIEDRLKMDRLLEKNPKRWSDDERSFMKRMSRKNIPLYVDENGNIFTKEELAKNGINVGDPNFGKEQHELRLH